MRKATWCSCGCKERVLVSVLPPRAARLINRRRVAEAREQRAAQVAAMQEQFQQAAQLLLAPAGGNA
jgi:hypothetical protein